MSNSPYTDTDQMEYFTSPSNDIEIGLQRHTAYYKVSNPKERVKFVIGIRIQDLLIYRLHYFIIELEQMLKLNKELAILLDIYNRDKVR